MQALLTVFRLLLLSPLNNGGIEEVSGVEEVALKRVSISPHGSSTAFQSHAEKVELVCSVILKSPFPDTILHLHFDSAKVSQLHHEVKVEVGVHSTSTLVPLNSATSPDVHIPLESDRHGKVEVLVFNKASELLQKKYLLHLNSTGDCPNNTENQTVTDSNGGTSEPRRNLDTGTRISSIEITPEIAEVWNWFFSDAPKGSEGTDTSAFSSQAQTPPPPPFVKESTPEALQKETTNQPQQQQQQQQQPVSSHKETPSLQNSPPFRAVAAGTC
uniref:Uncharacterized protein n=1 Tax=Chromera velia CCMP2878 TaxID=1169474 RepID=A0A0G4HD14_9ALVE|eukprot:Cvel_6383.t1-p1 / transcript=Cvel_6383.t1 / gene=Cvel_6383 / organism=Chromera_velia_CCMP2878 / gene_product=hypothetical protein / transcript_product=hypothetical protein / location=Cvel_scaffold311:19203-22266(-) / protein_length=271 / sequence_SO=supercontig / SO=protein_coding / is_pseudo=false